MGTPDNLSKDLFAAQVMSALKRAGDQRQTTFDSSEFQLHFSGDGREAGFANLHNFYAEHVRLPREHRQEHMRAVVRGLLAYRKECPTEWSEAQPDVRPSLRTRSFVENGRLQVEVDRGKPFGIAHLPIGEHMAACLAYDLPEVMMLVNDEMFSNWGVSLFEAMETARHNLEAVEFKVGIIGEGTYVTAAGDAYDATRLLLPDFIRSLTVKGRPVALVPNRESALITGEDDLEGLKLITGFADEAIDGPRPLSGMPLVFDNDEWTDWEPPADHPLRPILRRLEVKSFDEDYATQAKLLEALYLKRGEDVFVASYSGFQTNEGLTFSYAVWTQGCHALLPKTHELFFFDPQRDLKLKAPWNNVAAVADDLMEATDLYPPRVRVQDFPTDAQLREMRAEPI